MRRQDLIKCGNYLYQHKIFSDSDLPKWKRLIVGKGYFSLPIPFLARMLANYRQDLVDAGLLTNFFQINLGDAYRQVTRPYLFVDVFMDSVFCTVRNCDNKDILHNASHILKMYDFNYCEKVKSYKLKEEDYPKVRLTSLIKSLERLGIVVEGEILWPSKLKLYGEELAEDVRKAIEEIDSNARQVMAIYPLGMGRFSIKFSYHPQLIEMFSNKTAIIKGITTYNPATRARETSDLDTILEIIDTVKNARFMQNWKIIISGVEELVERQRVRDEKMRKPIPQIVSAMAPEYALTPLQNEITRFIIDRDGKSFNGSDMGTGKTVTSLAVLVAKKWKAIVVCPLIVRNNWYREALKFFPSYFKPYEFKTSKKIDQDFYDSNLIITTYESVGKLETYIKEDDFQLMILDESQYVKNMRTARFNNCERLRKKIKRCLPLSGTAVENNKKELFSQLYLMDKDFMSRDALSHNTIGRVWEMLQPIYIRKSLSEVEKELPPMEPRIITCQKENPPEFEGPLSLEEMNRVKLATAMFTIDTTIEYIKEILDSSDHSIIVCSEYREVVEIISQAVDSSCLHLGTMHIDKRNKLQDDFREKKFRVFCTTRKSVQIGANLIMARHVIYNDRPYNPALVAQMDARIRRKGQTEKTYSAWIDACNSFSSYLSNLYAEKKTISRGLTEGKTYNVLHDNSLSIGHDDDFED